MPAAMPRIPPGHGQDHRLDEELQEDVDAACAPMAMRMPISRVRSVTLTSMMFMIPMPPTSSDTAATMARRSVTVRLLSSWALAISARFRIEKSSSARAADVVAVAQERRSPALSARGRRGGADEDRARR